MRVVLDTNILARASRAGLARELLQNLRTGAHSYIVSPFIIAELSEVLRYDRLRRMHRLDGAAIDQHVRDIAEGAVRIIDVSAFVVPIVPDDPEDDLIIATAIAGQAEVICTLDRHLRHPDVQAYCAQHGIRIMTDVELLQLLRQMDTPQD